MRRKKIGGLLIALLCGVAMVGCGQKVEVKNQETSYIFDFQGLNAEADVPKWGNHILNLKQYISGIVCPDEENQCTYYVNCGRDDYLYRLQDGESTLVLPQVVSSLNIWEGELYFVSHADGDVCGTGNICKWNPATNEQETVIEAPVQYFRMNKNGIYFVEGRPQEFEGGFMISLVPMYYSFEENRVTEHSYGKWDAYGDYVMQSLVVDNELAGIGLRNPNTEELIEVYPASNSNYLIYECIFGDFYYGVSNNEELLVRINLQNGAVDEVRAEDLKMAWAKIKDYTELDGEIYVSLENDVIARLDQEKNSLVPMSIQIEESRFLTLEEIEAGQYEEKVCYSYVELYTDGEALYALKHYTVDPEVALPDGLLLVQLKPEGDSFVEIPLGNGGDLDE